MRFVATVLIVGLLPLTSPAQTVPSSGPGLFGVDLDPGMDVSRFVQEGITWARVRADWSILEPERGKLSWSDLDAIVGRAAAAGMHLALVLVNTPKWAALDPGAAESVWRHQPPRNVADWQRFVGAAAARYRGRATAWQIEPTLDFAVFRGTVQDYLEMLHAARTAIGQADPQARVVAAAPPGLDLSYIKAVLGRSAPDFDALMLSPRARSPEDVLEALTTVRARIPLDAHHEFWLSGGGEQGTAGTPGDTAGDLMARTAAVAAAAGVAKQFWSGPETAARWTSVRTTLVKMFGRAQFVGWLRRGPGVYAFVITAGQAPSVVLWSTGSSQAVPLASDAGLKVLTDEGVDATPGAGSGRAGAPAGKSPVFVQGIAASVVSEAAGTAQGGPFQLPRDAAHDFSRADSVSVVLSASNTERGLYNQRFRTLPSGAVVPITLDAVEAVRTDLAKDAVYVYVDVDHSFAYFVDGQQDILIAVEVHRAGAPQTVGFNLLYDSTAGYRFTPWQWIEPGTGWVTYTLRLRDAAFSSAWGWDFAINGAADKKEPLVVHSITVRKVAR